jgi:hypothetical protein
MDLGRLRPYITWIVLAVALFVPALVSGSLYLLTTASIALVFMIYSEAWNFLAASGQGSLGHAAFFGLGAYVRNLRLIIQQSEDPDKEGKKRISRLRWNYIRDEINKSLSALIHFDRELTVPTIEITLPKADATILYRALPSRPKLLLYL